MLCKKQESGPACLSPSIRQKGWTPAESRAVCVIKAAQELEGGGPAQWIASLGEGEAGAGQPDRRVRDRERRGLPEGERGIWGSAHSAWAERETQTQCSFDSRYSIYFAGF